jgi:hypothetical protein
MDDKLSRRDVLKRSAALGLLAAVGSAACSKPKTLSCNDTMSLSSADAQTRVTLQYVDNSMQPGKMCSGCQQFIPAAPDQCGTCKVVKGPINPKGYCKSFVAKPA